MSKYSYKLEDYGGGKISYVIFRDGKAIFHSNGYATRSEAIVHAQSHITDYKFEDEGKFWK